MQLKEQIEKEIEKYSEIIGITVEEAKAVFDSVVSDNGLNIDTEEGLLVARSVFRSKFAQLRSQQKKETDSGGDASATEYTGPTFTQRATGFFYASEAPRDWEESRRTNLLAEYQRDENGTLNAGKLAIAVQLSDGRYEVTMSRNDTEPTTKILEKLPESKMEVDEGKWIIPVDSRKAFQSGQPNKDYGKPTPLEAWSKRLFFVGKVGDDTVNQEYQMRIKDSLAKEFNPTTFTWCEFDCIPSSNMPNVLHGRKDGTTLNSLNYIDSEENLIEVLQDVLSDKVSALVSLDTFHSDNSHKQSHERIVITDGNVSNMNLQLTSNGNQTLHISDLNADFDYDGEGYSSFTCWIPDYINIDFGIGSNVIVSGRTSQREVDGEMSSVSINVLGLYVIDRHGTAEIVTQPTEGEPDWF